MDIYGDLGGGKVKIDPFGCAKSRQVVKDGACVPDAKTYTVGPHRACSNDRCWVGISRTLVMWKAICSTKKWSFSEQRVVLQASTQPR